MIGAKRLELRSRIFGMNVGSEEVGEDVLLAVLTGKMTLVPPSILLSAQTVLCL